MKRLVWLYVLLLLLPSIGFAASEANTHYQAYANEAGKALHVDPLLIQAVIETESAYDPNAVSSAHALGLMQLIPKYGALEAYRWLYGKNGIPTDDSLKRPRVNIWLGTAYLRLLRDEYFSFITDPQLRRWAIIVAYNWGPSKTLKRIFPKRKNISLKRFITRLDSLAPMETRKYLRKVMSCFVRLVTTDTGPDATPVKIRKIS